MTTPWAELIRLISNGEPVDATTTNRPTQDLAQRTQYLKELLAAFTSGSVLLHQDAALQSGLVVGTPVYLNSSNIYTAAQASATGTVPDAQAYAVGVVHTVTSATSGHIALSGKLTLTTTQWAAVIDTGSFAAGKYYVSPTQPGKLTASRAGLGVYVGQLLTDGTFITSPRSPAYTEHSHVAVTLSGNPAGTVVDPIPGGLQVVTTPNTSVQGWLPATPTYFPGWTVGVQIPTNAKFGYNLQHANEGVLRGLFPPIPVEAATATQSGVGITPFPLLLNSYGLWWMDNTYGEAPWPVDYAVSGTAPTIQLWVTKSAGTTATQVVTSLEKHPSSALDFQLLDPSDNPATVGALRLKILAILTAGVSTDEAVTAIKSLTASAYTSGPVVTRVKPGANVTVTSAYGDSTAGYYGPITIAASGSGSLAGTGVLASLGSAVTGATNDFRYTSLVYGTTTTPTWELEISDTAPSLSTLTPLIWVYVDTGGSLTSAFTVQTKLITPSAIGVVAATPTWSTAVQVSSGAVTAGNVYKILLPTVASVPSGTRCLLRLTRAASDAYTGTIGVLKAGFTLT